ncbi:MAG: DUF1428 domain-containing protein [Pseudomonadota bacterium]
MAYVECFVAAVPKESENEYKEHTRAMANVFRDHGASRVVDCWGADVPDGKTTSFPLAVKAEENEIVALGWIEWNNKETRDAGMEKAMKDERLVFDAMPFDGKRLIFAGFEIFSDL